jgi:hypothetical protein
VIELIIAVVEIRNGVQVKEASHASPPHGRFLLTEQMSAVTWSVFDFRDVKETDGYSMKRTCWHETSAPPPGHQFPWDRNRLPLLDLLGPMIPFRGVPRWEDLHGRGECHPIPNHEPNHGTIRESVFHLALGQSYCMFLKLVIHCCNRIEHSIRMSRGSRSREIVLTRREWKTVGVTT